MGKSITGTLIGMLIHQGAFKLEDPAPVPEWRKTPGDPRAEIRVMDLLRMSSGLRFSRGSPGGPPGYHDHDLIYTGAIDAFQFAVTRQPQFAPNTVGRYRNVDPMTLGTCSFAMRCGSGARSTSPGRSVPSSTRSGSAARCWRPIRTATFCFRDTTTAPHATGRASACCT